MSDALGGSSSDPADVIAGRDASEPTVVIVDDQRDVVFLLQRLLQRAGFEVVGVAEDGAAAVHLVTTTQPDVVLLDLAMPRLGGEAALPLILREAPRTMVAIVSAYLNNVRAESLLRSGAFAAYDKSELDVLGPMLADDLGRFRRIVRGEDDLPAWQHRYRTL